MTTMLPRHGMYYRARDLRENRRAYALPPQIEARAGMAAYPVELGMLLRLGSVVLVAAAIVACIMLAAG